MVAYESPLTIGRYNGNDEMAMLSQNCGIFIRSRWLRTCHGLKNLHDICRGLGHLYVIIVH